MNELYTNGPVEASFLVYEDFLYYKSGNMIISSKISKNCGESELIEGVYQHVTGKYMGSHAVKILGWGTENSTAYWLAANSWNMDWGDEGQSLYFQPLRI